MNGSDPRHSPYSSGSHPTGRTVFIFFGHVHGSTIRSSIIDSIDPGNGTCGAETNKKKVLMSRLFVPEGLQGHFGVDGAHAVDDALFEFVDDDLGRAERGIDLVEVEVRLLEDLVERLAVPLGLVASGIWSR